MFEIAAFLIALTSVFLSVFVACKTDTSIGSSVDDAMAR